MKRSVLPLLLLALACAPAKPAESPKAAPPAAALGPAGVRPGTVELLRWQEPAERVVIGPGGVALGPSGEPLTQYLFVSRDRLEDLQALVRTYAPFRRKTESGELAFGGKGRAAAGEVEQRMILEWVRMVAAEMDGGRSSTAYGMVFAWHRGGAVGSCEDLAVYLTGEVRAGSCAWDREVRGRLAPEQLARIYGWFDDLAPFQFGGEEAIGSGREPSRLVFAGRGRQAATPAATAEMRGLAAALHRDLAGRRPGGGAATPPPVAETEPESGKKSSKTEPAAPQEVPPTGRLLLPPDTVAGTPPAAIPPDLQPPEVPGAPPMARKVERPASPGPSPPSPLPSALPPPGRGAPPPKDVQRNEIDSPSPGRV
jgi:hypothetical protein